MIYLDQAATTFPKPPEVSEAVFQCLQEFAVNPSRGEHQLARKASLVVEQARAELARLFGIPNPRRIAFFMNATQAINQALWGWLQPGDHVVTSSMEHNAVRRPLVALQKKGVKLTILSGDEWGVPSPEEVEEALLPHTRLVVLNHASNVNGAVAPIAEIGQMLKKYQVPLLVDAAQTAGILPLHLQEMHIDMLAFSGHKGLYGPQGVGGLYVREGLELVPWVYGGTGIHSADEEQPASMPERLESGTLNTPGLAGLAEAVSWLNRQDGSQALEQELKLIRRLYQGVQNLPHVRWFGPPPDWPRVPVAALRVEGYHSEEVAILLDQHFEIAVRGGLHCAPLVHQRMGTMETGLVRVSVGRFNQESDIDRLLEALSEMAG